LTRLPIQIHKLTKPNAGDRIIFAWQSLHWVPVFLGR
jgi:hypothetical protein